MRISPKAHLLSIQNPALTLKAPEVDFSHLMGYTKRTLGILKPGKSSNNVGMAPVWSCNHDILQHLTMVFGIIWLFVWPTNQGVNDGPALVKIGALY
ncbi:hypothetical protein V6N13_028114 [Hibiscus sabdariffa]|uniref:Uncharacterized protein n=2 Tax=Hibiscus sabdariffa TaxID=183260 RepID=A0ABR1ZZS2_9ROSI